MLKTVKRTLLTRLFCDVAVSFFCFCFFNNAAVGRDAKVLVRNFALNGEANICLEWTEQR